MNFAAKMSFCSGSTPILGLHIVELHCPGGDLDFPFSIECDLDFPLSIEWDLVRVSPLLCQLKCTIERTVAVVAHCLQTYNLKQALKKKSPIAETEKIT